MTLLAAAPAGPGTIDYFIAVQASRGTLVAISPVVVGAALTRSDPAVFRMPVTGHSLGTLAASETAVMAGSRLPRAWDRPEGFLPRAPLASDMGSVLLTLLIDPLPAAAATIFPGGRADGSCPVLKVPGGQAVRLWPPGVVRAGWD